MTGLRGQRGESRDSRPADVREPHVMPLAVAQVRYAPQRASGGGP